MRLHYVYEWIRSYLRNVIATDKGGRNTTAKDAPTRAYTLETLPVLDRELHEQEPAFQTLPNTSDHRSLL
jgi:hypothetical protein